MAGFITATVFVTAALPFWIEAALSTAMLTSVVFKFAGCSATVGLVSATVPGNAGVFGV